ncbi:MAG: response regulator transcription factor [Planctomycetes bacterium]|nr:response regulator transcription factor [Planctomycetota bacterium]
MSKIPVFLVDDHPVVREGIRRVLEMDEGISIVGEADSAEEALNQLQFSSLEVVLMDIRLPGISGIEATRQLKSQHPEVHVVILSGFGDDLAELLGLFLRKNGNALGGGREFGLQCACQHGAELRSEGISRHVAEYFLSQFNDRIGAEATLVKRT